MIARIRKYLNAENALWLLGSAAFSGAAVYRAYALNWAGILIAILLISAGWLAWQRWLYDDPDVLPHEREPRRRLDWAILGFFLALAAAAFFLLIAGRTDRAIITPWEAVPPAIFAFYGLAICALAVYLYRTGRCGRLPLGIFSVLALAVAAIVYRLGYGFDPFIHQATERIITDRGYVDPKPWYYLGQYALVVIAHKLSWLPLEWIDRLLVPVLAALYLPVWLTRTARADGAVSHAGLTVLTLLILPFGIFIMTTPQALSYLFLLLAVLAGTSLGHKTGTALAGILALAALLTQPIAGIPALLYASALFWQSLRGRIKPRLFRTGMVAVFVASALALPLVFLAVNRQLNGTVSSEAAFTGAPVEEFSAPVFPRTEDLILNTAYFFINNRIWLIAILIGAGLVLAWQRSGWRGLPWPAPTVAAGLAISYVLTLKIPFSFLINYERSDYAERLLVAACLLLVPLILVATRALIESLRSSEGRFLKAAAAAAFVLLATANLYGSYPRHDHYYNSRGLSTSRSDIEAVRWIEADAQGEDYIVLANQQVSAAALREFGFKRYYRVDPSPATTKNSPFEGCEGDEACNAQSFDPAQDRHIRCNAPFVILEPRTLRGDRIPWQTELTRDPIGCGLQGDMISVIPDRDPGSKKNKNNPFRNWKLEIGNWGLDIRAANAQEDTRASSPNTIEIFYYPIPTGGPLYKYYLDMVYKYPDRETVEAAMDLVGVDRAYFVLNRYWWAADRLRTEAALEADSQYVIDNEVFIFSYQRPPQTR